MAPIATPMTAAHLLRRAAWGGSPEEIENVVDVGIGAAVDALLDHTSAPTVGEPLRRPGFDAYDLGALQSWFASLAATSPTPALERLTWFWSGHFATSLEKVELTDLLHQQWVTCRHFGLGALDTLLKAIARDPAMNLWLDLELSVVGNPNENFARELMELFSLGAGNRYSQADVVNAARAFTGHALTGYKGRPQVTQLVRSAHDYGLKTFMGEQGNFDGDDIIDLIVQQRECHEFISRRFWYRYAGTEPGAAVLSELADALGQRLRIDDLLRTMLTMDAFYTQDVQNGLVSQPFEVLVRAIRGFELDLYDAERQPFDDDEDESDQLPVWFVNDLCILLTQEPGLPPNVAGWPHNAEWLDSNRAAGRLVAGIKLGRAIAELESPVADTLRSVAHEPERLAGELFSRFGVVEYSLESVASVGAATSGHDAIESVAAAFAVAFTSPEVTLA